MNYDIGSVIRKKMEERSMTVTELAHQFGCSRNNMYKIFNKKSVDTTTLYRLSVILKYNFFAYYHNILVEKEKV